MDMALMQAPIMVDIIAAWLLILITSNSAYGSLRLKLKKKSPKETRKSTE